MSVFDRWRALLRVISTALSRLKSMMPIFIWTLLMQPRGLFKQPLRVGSGIYIAGLLERLGVAETIKSKVTRPESDIVSELVAKGEVELGPYLEKILPRQRGVEGLEWGFCLFGHPSSA